ncbi:hypothetical protein DRN73_02985 [Candidatus Pacearchaeota archaeon]|nr:MAG: hypothetical protein DRN73_02985 [Candidatus Pacearchaeota archaeon]
MDYKKYRWFFTKSEKLVYGGKSAVQNEEIVKEIIKKNSERIVMHTKIPGSPFAIIDAPLKKVNESDLEETAVWTACFSRAWRTGLYKTQVDIFTNNQILKEKNMKPGTFAVKKVQRKNVLLKLFLINQKRILRAVPEKTLKKNTKVFAKIIPGKEKKEKIALEISKKLNKKIDEVLNALPTGGIKIQWQK